MSSDQAKKEIIIVQRRLTYDTYIKMIENSIGTNIFKNSFGIVNDKKIDLTNNGALSCAFFVSSILKLCDYISTPHLTVSGTINDLIQNGWKETDVPYAGSILVWRASEISPGIFHEHVGFYISDLKIISNDSRKGFPVEQNYEDEKHKIDKILSHSTFIKPEVF